MASASSKRDLFGGSIQSEFPSNMLDASDLRQVPDTQEVLLSPDSDITAILEVLQSVAENSAEQSLEEAIKFHFDSLAHDNDATTSSISKIYKLPNLEPNSTNHSSNKTPVPILCHGIQEISKFGRDSSKGGGLDKVRIWVSLWRLKEKNVDLVLSFNEPLRIVEPPKEEESGQDGNQNEAGSKEGKIKEVKNQNVDQSRVKEIFEKSCLTLEILDWGLFA